MLSTYEIEETSDSVVRTFERIAWIGTKHKI